MSLLDDLARFQLWGSMGNKKRRPTLIDGLWGDFQYFILGNKDRRLPSVGDVALLWAWDRVKTALGFAPPAPAGLPEGFPERIYTTIERIVNARGGWAGAGDDARPLFWVERDRCSITPFSYIVPVQYDLAADPGKVANWETALEDQLGDLNVRIAYRPLRLEIDRKDPPTVKLGDYWAELATWETNSNLCSPGVALKAGRIGVRRYELTNEQLSNIVVGNPGSGKTQLTLGLILTLCYLNAPQHLSLIIVDPKVVDWLPLRGLPHLSAPIATTGRRGLELIDAMVELMESRMRDAERGLRVADMLPVVIYIDEMADLIDGLTKGEAERVVNGIKRLSQTGRGLQIGIIGATQRIFDLPAAMYSKLNGRFVGRTATAGDGAAVAGAGVQTHKLPGRGAFEFYPGGERLQGFFVADPKARDYNETLGRFASDIATRWAGQTPHWSPGGPTVATDDAGGTATMVTEAKESGAPVDEFLELALATYLEDPQGFTQSALRRMYERHTGRQTNGEKARALWAELMAYGRAKFNRLG